VTPGVRLVASSRPGYEGSDPRPNRRVVDCADDLRELADALKLERFGLVGFSDGGAHALACAARLGERVTAVVSAGGRAPGIETAAFTEDDEDDPAQREGALADWSAIFTRPWGFEPAEIRVPTLLCRGDLDHVPAAHAEHLARAIPGVELRVWPGLGHDAVFARWAEVVAFVLQ